MATYVALIRGIGPGDPRKSNESLRGAMQSLGFERVSSVISSGNVVFQSDATDTRELEDRIEAGWRDLLGFEAATIVRSAEQLQEIVDRDPFGGAEHGRATYLLATFFKHPTKVGFELPYRPPDRPYELVDYFENTLFTIADTKAIPTTDLMAWLESHYGKQITSRTFLTVQRILKRTRTG